ncbi:MAG: outer membrane protein transport protein [Rhodocyclaceae bacterium]|nr:outer membrane protein transport protein [Rhodocyclaceae bacterium]MBX3667204.1 outer membrane protein transport protein [Rhodocyclaceae bacterium]
MLQKKIAVAVALAAVSAAPGLALATDVFRLEGIGAVSRAMGGTATAHDVGPGGMLTNPATLSLGQSNREIMLGLDVVTTDITAKDLATGETADSHTHSNNRGPYYAPEVAYTQRVGSWTFGVGAFAQGGLGTEFGRDSFLSRANAGVNSGLENSSRLLVLDIPFAASYRVSDALTVGASLDAMWQGLNLDLLLGLDQVGSLIASGRVNGTLALPPLQGAHFSLTQNKMLGSGVDAWGYGGRIGMTYQVSADTRLGAAYSFKSQIADMKGNATLSAVTAGGNVAVPGKIKILDFQMPARLDLGLNHRLTPQWTVAMDISQVFWKDVMKDIKVAFDSAAGNLNIQLPQNYRDQTVLALGASYAWTPALTLRAGARFATQALRGDTLFAVVPAIPTKHASFGLSYVVAPGSRIDFAYSHAFKETMQNRNLPNTSDPIEVSHSQNNVTLNYSLSF